MRAKPASQTRCRVESLYGGAGMCDDFPLAYSYTAARTLRFADGPDEVHRNAIAIAIAIAKMELGKYMR